MQERTAYFTKLDIFAEDSEEDVPLIDKGEAIHTFGRAHECQYQLERWINSRITLHFYPSWAFLRTFTPPCLLHVNMFCWAVYIDIHNILSALHARLWGYIVYNCPGNSSVDELESKARLDSGSTQTQLWARAYDFCKLERGVGHGLGKFWAQARLENHYSRL